MFASNEESQLITLIRMAYISLYSKYLKGRDFCTIVDLPQNPQEIFLGIVHSNENSGSQMIVKTEARPIHASWEFLKFSMMENFMHIEKIQ